MRRDDAALSGLISHSNPMQLLYQMFPAVRSSIDQVGLDAAPSTECGSHRGSNAGEAEGERRRCLGQRGGVADMEVSSHTLGNSLQTSLRHHIPHVVAHGDGCLKHGCVGYIPTDTLG